MTLKFKLSNLLKMAKQEVVYEDDERIHLPFVMFNFHKNTLVINFDIGMYPDEAAKIIIPIEQFCRLYNLKLIISESYVKINSDIFYGKDAAAHYLQQNYLEMANLKAWDKILEKSFPEDLHMC